MFAEDGDPCQNSRAAKTALDKITAVQFSISPRSRNLNPIENVFKLHIISCRLYLWQNKT